MSEWEPGGIVASATTPIGPPNVALPEQTATGGGNTALATTWKNIESLTLPAGTWLLIGNLGVQTQSAPATFTTALGILSTTSQASTGQLGAGSNGSMSLSGEWCALSMATVAVFAASTTVYLECECSTTSGGPTAFGSGSSLTAIRIA